MKSYARLMKLMLLLVFVCGGILAAPVDGRAEVMYNTYIRDANGLRAVQPAYSPVKVIGHDLFIPDAEDPEVLHPSPMRNPQDVYITENDEIYVADTGNNRIIHFDAEGNFLRFIEPPQEDRLNRPQGVFVAEDGRIYVADTGNKRVVMMDADGHILLEIGEPDSKYMPTDYKYDPIKVIVDKRGYIYVVTLGGYYGAMQFDPQGNFTKFYGMNETSITLIDALKRALYTREMYENEMSKLPPSISNITIDQNGFIYTVTSGQDVTKDQVKKLNFEGKNILSQYNSLGEKNTSYGEYRSWDYRAANRAPVNLVDVSVDNEGNFIVIDKQYKFISQYDADGALLFFWGGQSANNITQLGLVKNPASIEINSRKDLFILDDQENILQMFRLSEFGALVYQANSLTMQGKYLESEEIWKQVIKLNGSYTPALQGLAKAAYKKGEYERAAELFYLAGNNVGYSESYWQIRLEWIQSHFADVATIIIIAAIILTIIRKLWRRFGKPLRWQSGSARWQRIIAQVKHVRYVLKHPIDGFTALRYENKGNVLSALILYLLVYISIVFAQYVTSFTFNPVKKHEINAFMILLAFILIVGAWIICNYLISSIYRGEGRFRDVFIGTAYTLVPFIVIGVPLAIVSNVLTKSEGPIYQYINIAMYVWIALLIIWKVMSLQSYSVGETLANIFLSIFAIAVSVVLIGVLVGLSTELLQFIREVYQEVTLR